MALRRVIFAALAFAAIGYAGAAQRPAVADPSSQLLQVVAQANECFRLGRLLVDTVVTYLGHAKHAAATGSTLLALAQPTAQGSESQDHPAPNLPPTDRGLCMFIAPQAPAAPIGMMRGCTVHRGTTGATPAWMPASLMRKPSPMPPFQMSRRVVRVML